MKKFLMIYTILLAMVLTGIAQPPDGRPPREQQGDGGPWEAGRMAPPGHEPASPLHQIMEDLREKDPERLAHLKELRFTDPQSFREEARALIHEVGLQKLEEEKPAIYAVVTTLSREDQEWLIDTMAKSKLLDHQGKRWNKQERKNERQDRKQLGSLINKHKQSQSDEEKNTIRAELKGYIAAQYDQRLEMRMAQLREMEEKVDQIRRAAEQGEQNRATIIDEKVDFLLNSEWKRETRRKADQQH